MAKSRFLYEVLVRGADDGSISGAHQIWAEKYTDDDTGQTIAINVGNAEVLNTTDVGQIVGENFAGAAAQISSLTASLASSQQTISDQQSQIASLNQKIEALTPAATQEAAPN